MGKAVLIYGGTYKDRVETLKNQGIMFSYENSAPDTFIIEKEENRKSIGIETSRSVKKFLKEKPLNKDKKTVAILKAELMTTEAQNALLKIIEEPPSYAEIYLLSKTENSLLDTVVSRCVKKRADACEENQTSKSEILKIVKMNTGERLDKAKEISEMEKEELIAEMEKWVIDLRLQRPGENLFIKKIEMIVSVKKSLEETNVNPRLAIEALLLNL